MRRRGKVDISQPGIVRALRDAGCTVVSLAPLGNSIPDLLVGVPSINGAEPRNELLECKTLNHRLRSNQRDFVRDWKGRAVHVVCTPDEALEVLGLRKGDPVDNDKEKRDLADIYAWCEGELETMRKNGAPDAYIEAFEGVREMIRTLLLRFA